MEKSFKSLIMALFSQVPIIAAAKIWWTDISENPLIAIMLWFLYSAPIFVWANLGKDIWDKLKPQLVNKATDWVEMFIANIFSSFLYRYKKKVYESCRDSNARGLLQGKSGFLPLELKDVFVDLKIARKHPSQQIKSDLIAFTEDIKRQSIWQFLKQIEKNDKDATALVIIGVPGSGKTTLLQYIALTFASNKQDKYHVKTYIPILLFLREHVKTIIEKSPTLAELTQSHFSSLNPPLNWFENRLKMGKFLILLDGFDEVAKKEHRQIVSLWVKNQIREYSRCRFIITSRPKGYEDAPLEQSHELLEVGVFTDKQIDQFIYNWYLANEAFGREIDDGIREKATKLKEDLLNRLNEHLTLKNLAVNPLLLKMIVMIHDSGGTLPKRRVDLYAQICETMLGGWRASRGIDDPLQPSDYRTILQPLAAYMMNRERTVENDNFLIISTEEALNVVEPELNKIKTNDIDGVTFLKRVEEVSGLFVEREVGMWGFSHFTIQEYLCAAYWDKTQEPANWDIKQWRSLIADSWWHETIRLYSAQCKNSTSLAIACIKINTIDSLTLAFEIAEEALVMDADIRKRISSFLHENLETSNIERCRLFSTIFLKRHLKKSFQPINEQDEIDSEYLSNAEYQLFLDEVNKHHIPDQWKGFRFPRGEAKSPITGMRIEEAQEFCQWLTVFHSTTLHENCQYRLPSSNEIKRFPSESADCFTTWINERKLFQLSSIKEAELREQLKKLSEYPLPPSFDCFAIEDFLSKNKHDLIDALSISLGFSGEEIATKINNSILYENQINDALLDDLAQEHELNFQMNRFTEYRQELDELEDFEPKLLQEIKDFKTNKHKHLHKIKESYYKEISKREGRPYDIDKIKKEKKPHEINKVVEERYDDKLDELERKRRSIQSKKNELSQKIVIIQQQIPILNSRKAIIENRRHEHEQKRNEIRQFLEYNKNEKQKIIQGKPMHEDILSKILYLLPQKEPIFLQEGVKNDKILAITLYFASISNDIPNIFDIEKAIVSGCFLEALDLLPKIHGIHLSSTQAIQAALLTQALKAAQAAKIENFFEWRSAHHKLAMLIAEYAYQGSRMISPPNKNLQQVALEFYWYYRIIVAREADELPAWEGIRLVRKRK